MIRLARTSDLPRLAVVEDAADARTDWLAGILAREVAAGFDPARRVAMVRRP